MVLAAAVEMIFVAAVPTPAEAAVAAALAYIVVSFLHPRWLVRASALRAEDPGFESRLRQDFFPGSSHTSDFYIGTPVTTLPGAWRYRVSAGTSVPGVSIL